eukprot:7584780-Ditylum_brightwellii.AAC.1
MTAETTATQTDIATSITKAAAMPTKIIAAIDATIIITKEAKEVAVVMTGKEEIVIILAIKASHIMQREIIVALVPNPRVAVAVALQAAAIFQAAAALVLALCQIK